MSSTLVLILLIVLLFGGGGFYAGGPITGLGTVGVILAIVLIFFLAGAIR